MQVSVFGEVRNVYESDGAKGIQDSINVSGAGDTVLVHDGIYYVRDVDSLGITMKDSIVFMSVNGAESCTLTGLNSTATDTAYHIIYCNFGDSSSYAAMIRGFTITNGCADLPFYWSGGGIYCNSSSPTIDSCVITNNRAGCGSGLYIRQSSPTIRNNTISNNSSTHEGSGLYIEESSPLIMNNRIANNSSGTSGGGLFIYYSSPAITRNMIINNNSSVGSGGGLLIKQASPEITDNVISNNSATYNGGGLLIALHSSALLTGNTITNNVSNMGGGIFTTFYSSVVIDSCFIADNGSFQETISGMAFINSNTDTTDTFKITHSHLYYNTFQPDTEIDNNTSITIPLENNFWWDKDSSAIQSLIEGPADIMPFEYDFIPGVPGEPTSIDSVRNYNNNYSVVIDSLWDDPDTLYLRIYGEDRNARFREAAVAIIKSSIYPSGIAVALIETDTNSGIYEGKAIVKTSTGSNDIRKDDIYQTVRVNSVCDSLQIVANMDTTQKFVVYYRVCPEVEESESRSGDLSHTRLFQNYPNPFTTKTVIRVQGLGDSKSQKISLKIYDLVGRLVKKFRVKSEEFRVVWDGKDKDGKMLGSGVYFYKLEAGDFTKTRKMFLIK